MAKRVGDLWPAASGTASLGVDQTTGPEGGFSTEIRPFNHIHLTSGVWHTHLLCQSGVIRFSQVLQAFEVSVDGGLTYAILSVGGDQALQAAYDGGDEILLSAQTHRVQNPVLLKEQPGFAVNPNGDTLVSRRFQHQDAAIAVSGWTATPDNPNSFGIVSLTSAGLTISTSGESGGADSDLSHSLYLGSTMNTTGDARDFTIATSGSLSIEVQNEFNDINALELTNVQGDIDISSLNGDVTVETGGAGTTFCRSSRRYGRCGRSFG